METKSVLGVVIAFAIAFTLMSGSGVGATIFGVEDQNPKALDELDKATNEQETQTTGILDGLTDSVPLLGAIIDFADTIKTFSAIIAFLPVFLTRLGFPTWFAFPIGVVVQGISAIGFFQVLTGREYI